MHSEQHLLAVPFSICDIEGLSLGIHAIMLAVLSKMRSFRGSHKLPTRKVESLTQKVSDKLTCRRFTGWPYAIITENEVFRTDASESSDVACDFAKCTIVAV
jgi:hypothetical protein